MQRRTSLTALMGWAGLSLAPFGSLAATVLQSLKPSTRMPVLFVGHGSPMNAIEDNHWRRSWQSLGAELLRRSERPQMILCISAHWLTRGSWQLTGMAQPRTIHDFGGFPQALFDQQYSAPGAPEVAKALARELRAPGNGRALDVDEHEWGLDHGTWSALKPMFPLADIPVVQLSMDYDRSPQDHYLLGQQLQKLRDRGVLIVGSGNIVHNLRVTRRGAAQNETYDWAAEFDTLVQDQIKKGQLDALAHFQKLGQVARMSHPTHEHYLPLLYAAGAARATEMPRFFNTGFQSASISMRSVLWG
ncbi:4,5-DOPA dioxygenase extradiol [Ottowia thiooxydans]|uniref:4,5-DOPA dioxygenase extradiol n=1 Tax=Ottowia thiooxydans TaxID=219182 RepID=A0ABV2QAG8_9BURK